MHLWARSITQALLESTVLSQWGDFWRDFFTEIVFFQASRALTVRPKFPQATVSPTKQLHKLEWERERMNKNWAKRLWGTLCSAESQTGLLTAPLIHQLEELPNSTRIFHAQSSWEYLMFIPICWWPPSSTKAHSQVIPHIRWRVNTSDRQCKYKAGSPNTTWHPTADYIPQDGIKKEFSRADFVRGLQDQNNSRWM